MRYLIVLFLFSLPVHAEHPEMINPMERVCPDPPSKYESDNYYCHDKEGVIKYPTETELYPGFPKKEYEEN